MSEQAELLRLANGYRISRAIQVAAELKLADLIAAGKETLEALAETASCHPPFLLRLLRALASVGILREEEGRRFRLTSMGEYLRSDHPQTVQPSAHFVGRAYYWQAWSALEHSIRTGENAFRHVHGMSVWDYRRQHPEESAIFDRAMQSGTARTHQAILEAFDFGRFGTIVDVGGGNGAFLSAILPRYPDLRAILFDQPHVVSDALLSAAGVLDRCEIRGGSFFEEVPAGGDAYMMKFIIHDWEDPEALAILAACRRAMAPGATMLLLEYGTNDADMRFSDIQMMVGPGGVERTVEEYNLLLEATGFRPVGTTPTGGIVTVIEAVAQD